ncbi:motility protein A [Dongia rigui]|uniref:MotA/TolQ/ExbB proton channel family protein n=1 Tax=Dongia rigui TaxID=940149 RepID=A0ABU5DT90_9PROT|nr:MotA/TolQ/ExbB proton channel family protein [Dongia rigui]MDY0870564.1 MotA/TolQ/ExbB proton channel family protein [Dongia rigui]
MSDTANDPIQSFTAKSDLPLRLEPARHGFDMATALGLIGALALIVIAIFLGGNWLAFVDVPSVLIVVCGTFAITTVSYSMTEIMQAQPLMFRTLFSIGHTPNEAAAKVLQLAERARRRGLLAMQNELYSLKNEPFLLRGMTMLVDGMPIEEVERNLTFETHAMAQRHQRSTGILRRAAEVSPAMGLIGTLIGLVQMLGSLNQPEGIGPAMAVALLTTFYGAVLANVFFLPIASKLERNSAIELLINQIFILGTLSIARQENPRRLELVLNTILPANQRVKYFD